MLYVFLGVVTSAIVLRGIRNHPSEDRRHWRIAGFFAPLAAAALGGKFVSDLLIISGRIPTTDGNEAIVQVGAFIALAATTALLAIAPRYIGFGDMTEDAPAAAASPERRAPTLEPRTITSG